jgi:molybdate transport system ATP-binding protein
VTVRADLNIPVDAGTLNAAFELPARGLFALLGPAGSGKTRLLRVLAGLDTAVGGLSVGDTRWQDGIHVRVPLGRRPVGVVFAEPRLFPHLSVRDNLQLTHHHQGGAAIDAAWLRDLLGLDTMAGLRADGLTPSQAFHVALGRTVTARTRLLLVDEPNLPYPERTDFLLRLARLAEVWPIPIVFATRSLELAARVTSRLLYLHQGKALLGSVNALVTDLALPLCRGREALTQAQAVVANHDAASAVTYLDCRAGRLAAPLTNRPLGRQTVVLVHSDGLVLSEQPPGGSSIPSLLEATVVEVGAHEGGGDAMITLTAGEIPLVTRVTQRTLNELKLEPGRRVFAQPGRVTLFR